MRWSLCSLALPALALYLAAPAAAAETQTMDPNLYVQCTFHPQGKDCVRAYQQALHDDSPAAASVRNAFQYYARYLKPRSSTLTDEDKRYLAQNDIRAPFDLNPADLGGLHNVINDPELMSEPSARRAAVNGFIARAVQAELYCGIDGCRDDASSPSS